MPARLHVWEYIQQDAYTYTARMRVPGGWLYRYGAAGSTNAIMAFVPDRRVEAKPVPPGKPDRRKTGID